MSARLAATAAIGISTVSVLSCFLFLPLLWSRMTSIQMELMVGMDEFKVIADDAWAGMMLKPVPKGNAPKARKPRQATNGVCRKFAFPVPFTGLGGTHRHRPVLQS